MRAPSPPSRKAPKGLVGFAHIEQALGSLLQGVDGIAWHGSLVDSGQSCVSWLSWPGGGIGTSSGSDFRLPRMVSGTLSKN